jgi:hypothetical protein
MNPPKGAPTLFFRLWQVDPILAEFRRRYYALDFPA